MLMRCLAFAAIAACPVPAASECFICDTKVVLDAEAAACFSENAERHLEAARNHPTQWTEVNLAGCDASRGLDTFPSLRAETGGASPDVSAASAPILFLDVAGIECLTRRLAGAEIGGVLEINLETDCE